MAVAGTEAMPTRVFIVEETPGQRIKRRREALGLDVIDLAQQAKVDRGQLARIEAGEVQRPRHSTIHAIESALDRLEVEMGGPYDSPEPRQVTFRIQGNFGVDVVVQGPVDDADELERVVERLILGMQNRERTNE